MASSDANPVGRVLEASGLALERARLLGSKRRVVVAVSGGADSLCLLDAMITLLDGARRRVVVGHVDHRLRPGSGADADHVRAVSNGYRLRCEVIAVDVPALMAAERRGLEEAARMGRYRALRDLAERTRAAAVVAGHTRDDSVETIVLHLVRGSGMRGLTGISEVEQFTAGMLGAEPDSGRGAGPRLIRPLLSVGRAETAAYCEARGIRYLTDASNADPAFTRNRVRGHLLPVLRTYNPSVDRALSRMARTLRDEDRWLDRVATSRWRRIARAVEGKAGLDLAGWQRQPVVLQRRLVRMIASVHGFDEVGFEAVERALEVGREGGPRRAELGGGMTVERRGATLFFDRTQQEEG